MKINNIKGIQKTTLIDYPGRVASTVFFGGCNLCCKYCHNVSLVNNSDPDLNGDEVLAFLISRKELINAICISGGEPTLTDDLPDFIRALKKEGFSVKLDTNGVNPKMIDELLGIVDYIAIDIKTSKKKYPDLVGNVDIEKIEESINKVIGSKIPHEFRMTAIPGYADDTDLKDIADWVGGKKELFFLQGFQSHTELLDRSFEKLARYSEQDLNNMKQVLEPYFKSVGVRA